MTKKTGVNGFVVPRSTPSEKVTSMEISLFDTAGAPVTIPKPAAAQANSTATDTAGMVTDFNALLAKLRSAGLLKSS